MSERWQRELSKLRGARLGEDLWERVAAGQRLEPLPVPTRSRIIVLVTAFAVFAGAAALVWAAFTPFRTTPTTLSGSDLVAVPPRGDTSAVFLADGRPVFVVHHEDGTVSVVDAFSTHRAWGVEELVVWCPSNRQFVEWAHEAHFDEYGTWQSAGPAPSGLATFAFDVVERDAIGDPARIRIGTMLEPNPHGSAPVTDPSRPPFCPPVGGVPNEVVTHTVGASEVFDSPADAVRAEPDGWIAVRGALLVASDGFVQLCAVIDGERCEGGAIVRGIDGVGLLVNVIQVVQGPSGYEVPRVWLAQVRGGLLDNLAIGEIRTAR
jgi:hypothetical protein